MHKLFPTHIMNAANDVRDTCTTPAWSTRNYPSSMKNLPARVRRKAIDILNALLAQDYAANRATIIAVSMAREWAEHDRAIRERNIHVLPRGSGWAVRRAGGNADMLTFDDKCSALAFACEMARTDDVIVVSHEDNGEIDAHIRFRCAAV